MKTTLHTFFLIVTVIILTGCAGQIPQAEPPTLLTPPTAQEPTTVTEPTGTFVMGFGSDATLLNPILAVDPPSFAVINMIFPKLIGQDPQSGEIVPTEMAEAWEASKDGLVWTFHLRENVFWSDGQPVTAQDFKFTYDAVASDLVKSPRMSFVDQIEKIETPDPKTIIITFKQVKCDALLKNFWIGWLPSHLYAADFSDINKYDAAPPVSAGPFVFKEWIRGESIRLEANSTYWKGRPKMESYVFKIVPDAGAKLAQLQAGEIDAMVVPPDQITALKADSNTVLYTSPLDGYVAIWLNLANPKNPQTGRDEEGEVIAQDPHPILSDKSVRKAISYSLDYDSIIDNIFLGQGKRQASNVLPAVTWAYDPTILPYQYDPDAATKLLDEAGWVKDPVDSIRRKDGNKLALNLAVPAGNTTLQDLAVTVQDQLKTIGFEVSVESLEYGTLVQKLVSQQFDMVLITLEGLGADPNDDVLWHSIYDIPNAGFNAISYYNPKVEELLQSGLSVPNCSTNDRAAYYKDIQRIINDDVPYVFIVGSVGNVAYSSKWEGLNPGPWNFYNGIENWQIKP